MIRVKINDKNLSVDNIKKWEDKRVIVSKKTLSKKLKKNIDIEDAQSLAVFKASMSDEKMLKILGRQLKLMELCTTVIVRLSHGKRKMSITEIDVDFCDSKTLKRMYDDMMLVNTKENRYSCLRANPDHYLLRGVDKDIQEVVEVTGELPWALRFFIHYGDFSGINSKQEKDYQYQAAGVSYLENGTAIGAVRHQMKDTKEGCRIKLTVEFPALMPNRNIRAHQYHLACEFYNWFSEFERRLRNDK